MIELDLVALRNDWHAFIGEAKRVEALIDMGEIDKAKAGIAYVAGLAMGLASRGGVTFDESLEALGLRLREGG